MRERMTKNARVQHAIDGCCQEQLKGARDNNRFLDKRLAELEAAIADGMTAHISGPVPIRPT